MLSKNQFEIFEMVFCPKFFSTGKCTVTAFIMYINDLTDICTNDTDLYLFADDAKICKYIRNGEDQAELQTTLSKMQNWSDTWLLKLNVQKCHVIR